MTDRRQKAFIRTYQDMFAKEKEQEAKMSKFAKCKRIAFKLVIGLIILAFLYPTLKGIVYNFMGWELIVDVPMTPPPRRPEPPFQRGDRTYEEYFEEEQAEYAKRNQDAYQSNYEDY